MSPTLIQLCTIPGYESPIVDHKTARQKALTEFKGLKDLASKSKAQEEAVNDRPKKRKQT